MRLPGSRTLRRTASRLRARLFGRGVILGYHRVADDPFDPWNLCVGTEAFREHMEVLHHDYRPEPLVSLVDGRRKGRDPGRRMPVAVTFDDGYSDLLHVALPVLERAEVPATAFVICGSASEPFWWDRLAEILEASPGLPARLKLPLDGEVVGWAEGEGPRALLRTLHQALRRLPPGRRDQVLRELTRWAGVDGRIDPMSRTWPRALTKDEIRRLDEHSLVDVGSHTSTHPELPDLATPELETEVHGSRQRLERLLSRPIEAFSYPYGLVDARVRDQVERSGYRWACTSRNGLVAGGSDPLMLPRLWPPGGSGDQFRRWLRSWTGRGG